MSRSALIRKAASLPKNSAERKELLKRLAARAGFSPAWVRLIGRPFPIFEGNFEGGEVTEGNAVVLSVHEDPKEGYEVTMTSSKRTPFRVPGGNLRFLKMSFLDAFKAMAEAYRAHDADAGSWLKEYAEKANAMNQEEFVAMLKNSSQNVDVRARASYEDIVRDLDKAADALQRAFAKAKEMEKEGYPVQEDRWSGYRIFQDLDKLIAEYRYLRTQAESKFTFLKDSYPQPTAPGY